MRAYLALLGSTLRFLCTLELSNSYGVFVQHYKQHQLKDYTNSDISWIGSLHLFLSSAFYSGILFDKGWFRYQLAIGSVGWLVGIFTLSFAKTYWQILLAQSVCMGLSLGLMFSPGLSILGTYFRRKRAFVETRVCGRRRGERDRHRGGVPALLGRDFGFHPRQRLQASHDRGM